MSDLVSNLNIIYIYFLAVLALFGNGWKRNRWNPDHNFHLSCRNDARIYYPVYLFLKGP